MPQFSPLNYITIISWSLLFIFFSIWFNQSVIFPHILRRQLARLIILFNGKWFSK